jgi:hypothetical protein
VAHCCVFFERYFCLWLIEVLEDHQLSVLLLKDEHALVVSLHLILTEPDLDSNCLCSLRAPSGLSNIGLSVKWLWRFFVESLSHPSMIKLVEQLQMEIALAYSREMSSFHYGFTHCVFTSVVLIAYGDTCVVFARPDQGYGQF